MINNNTKNVKFVANEKALRATANPDNMNSISKTNTVLEENWLLLGVLELPH